MVTADGFGTAFPAGDEGGVVFEELWDLVFVRVSIEEPLPLCS